MSEHSSCLPERISMTTSEGRYNNMNTLERVQSFNLTCRFPRFGQ